MRYLLSYPSSTKRLLLGLLCGGVLFSSCEKAPTDFGEPFSSEFPLKKLTLSNSSQKIIANNKIAEIWPYDDIEIELNEGEGLLTKGDAGTVITLHFESEVPISPDVNAGLERETGYTLTSFRMNLVITPSEPGNGAYLQQHQCVTDSATLFVTRKAYPWDPPMTISFPIDATIDSLVETTNDKGEPIFEGRIHLFSLHWPNNPADIFIYDLQANITIE